MGHHLSRVLNTDWSRHLPRHVRDDRGGKKTQRQSRKGRSTEHESLIPASQFQTRKIENASGCFWSH